ncbi:MULTISPECIES: DUF4400 domain-containing protein [Paraburkholderia]|uniref:DUF4400 domain-containing protein n=1 Tax=Paraburkholderia youngii TaxID=2782701 RepID=A0ABX2NYF6_9BURK|nr:DUF4400 domain-containing protein [Paraburkholderia youngii]NVI09138.1 DUF4400 domain-containing protein [Paraburkholderia youngii]
MASSRFVSHVKWWFFLVPLLALVVMPALPDRSLFAVPAQEAQSVEDVLGVERADEVLSLTNARFRRWFVDSGIIRSTLDASASGEIGEGGVSDFARSWVHNFWLEVYRVIYRASVMKLWLIGTFVFCVATFVDGSVRRKVRASAAGFASPLSFHLAGHGILLVFGVAFAVLAAPFPVLAQYWIAVAAVLGALLWKAAASFQ